MAVIYSEDWEDGTLGGWVKLRDEGDFTISNVQLRAPLGAGTKSEYVFMSGEAIGIGLAGDTDFLLSSGEQVSNTGGSSYVFESGSGVDTGGSSSGERALSAVETTGGGTIGMTGPNADNPGYDGGWVYDTLYFTEGLPIREFQTYRFGIIDAATNGQLLISRQGYDSNGNALPFQLQGSLIDTIDSTLSVSWDADTWYRLKIRHDGAGVYEGKLWRPESEGEPGYQIQSTGSAPASNRRPFVGVNGASGFDLDIHSDFVKVES